MGHDVGEARNPDDQNEGHDDTLDLTLRIEVSKTNGRHRCEHEVDNDRGILKVCELTKTIHIVESVLIIGSRRVLRHDEPHGAKEVSQEQDENDEAEDLKAFDQDDLMHDLVVVVSHIIAATVLAFDSLD